LTGFPVISALLGTLGAPRHENKTLDRSDTERHQA
jgi:hypothetical protein